MPSDRHITHRETVPVTTHNPDGTVEHTSFEREFTQEEWAMEQAVRKAIQETSCSCGSDPENCEWELYNDGECACGIHKHHWHCRKCGGVTQIG